MHPKFLTSWWPLTRHSMRLSWEKGQNPSTHEPEEEACDFNLGSILIKMWPVFSRELDEFERDCHLYNTKADQYQRQALLAWYPQQVSWVSTYLLKSVNFTPDKERRNSHFLSLFSSVKWTLYDWNETNSEELFLSDLWWSLRTAALALLDESGISPVSNGDSEPMTEA